MRKLVLLGMLACFFTGLKAQQGLVKFDTSLVSGKYEEKPLDVSYKSRLIRFGEDFIFINKYNNSGGNKLRTSVFFVIESKSNFCVTKQDKIKITLRNNTHLECFNVSKNCDGMPCVDIDMSKPDLAAWAKTLMQTEIESVQVFGGANSMVLKFTPEQAVYFKKALIEIMRLPDHI